MSPAYALLAKDLRLKGRTIASTLATCAIALLLFFTNPVGLTIGATVYLSGIVAFGCIVAMGIWKERSAGALLFALSLPISARGYLAARAAGALLTYLCACVPLLIAGIVVIELSPVIPHGLITLLLLGGGFLLLEFCVQTGVALFARSEGWMTAVLIVTNTSVSLFFWAVWSIPSVAHAAQSPAVVLDGPVLALLAAEILLSAVVLVVPIHLGARKSPL